MLSATNGERKEKALMAMAGPTATSSVTLQRRSWLERLWTTIADRGRPYADVPSQAVPPLDRARQLAAALLSEKGRGVRRGGRA